MPLILEVHHQQKNMMVFNVACVITSYLLMVSTIRSNPQLFAYLIQVNRTPMWCSSNPIKVNRWNFMSFVPNVASIEMAPLWPYDSMQSHWIGVWIPMANGTWTLLISPTSWKNNTSSGCWRAQDWLEIARFVCKCQLPFLCFQSNYAMSWSQMNSSYAMLWPTFTHSHQIVLCLSYICLAV